MERPGDTIRRPPSATIKINIVVAKGSRCGDGVDLPAYPEEERVAVAGCRSTFGTTWVGGLAVVSDFRACTVGPQPRVAL